MAIKRQELVKHWMESAEQDRVVMDHLFKGGHFVWSLFVGHLVIEKLLKAYYVKNVSHNHPRIHDLTRIAEKAGLEVDSKRRATLDNITGFNIEARYAIEKHKFYKKATRSFAAKAHRDIEEMRLWLLARLENP